MVTKPKPVTASKKLVKKLQKKEAVNRVNMLRRSLWS
jgi:hypothetical protein